MTTSLSSSSSSDCSLSDFSYSDSNSDSMATPSKHRTASGDTGTAKSMQASLKEDLKGHVHPEVDIGTFVKEVWGLDIEKALESIRKAEWPKEATLLATYKETLHRYREPRLHKPFKAIAAALVKNMCAILGLDHETAITTMFWDTKGNKELSSRLHLSQTKDRKRKPDMLDMYKQPSGYAPSWDHARSIFEFKKNDITKTTSTLPTISEVETSSSSELPPSPSSRPSTIPATMSSRSVSRQGSQGRTSSGGTAGSKRTHSEMSDGDSQSSQPSKRRRMVAVNGDEMQLATYALEALAAGSRHYTTGFMIDGFWITIWYYDRTAIHRTTTFDFSTHEGTLNLGLALYALSQCNMMQAGFDPHIHELVAPPPGKPITKDSALELCKPSSSVENKCYKFPIEGSSSDKQYVFPIVNYLYKYSGIVGRGTTVASVLVAIMDEVVRTSLYALKMSWQYNTRHHEATIIQHLHDTLPAYWRKHLPQPIFSATYTAAQLNLPRARMRDVLRNDGVEGKYDEEVRDVERDLHVIVNPTYTNLWNAESVDEFKRVFLDCFECHYHSYHTGRVLHRDISENNLMIYRPGKTDGIPPEIKKGFFIPTDDGAKKPNPPPMPDTAAEQTPPGGPSYGILNDFDMASMRDKDGFIKPTNTHHHHLTGTRPFMACELLDENNPPPFHLYRHDLESFFYILVWAAVHYDLKAKQKRSTVPEFAKWNGTNALDSKNTFITYTRPGVYRKNCVGAFHELWDTWITPLWWMFSRGFLDARGAATPDSGVKDYDHSTCGGHITFEKFMGAIGATPREPHPNAAKVKPTVTIPTPNITPTILLE